MSINFLVAIAMAHEKLLGISVNYTGNDTSSNTDSSTSDNLSLVVDDINTNLDYQDIPIQAKSYSFYKAAMGLNLYYSPMLIVVGFLGNSLSLVVMLQRNNRKFSCCVYLAGLALGDNLFMCNAFHLWLMTAIFPEQFTDLHCTIVAYSFQVRKINLLLTT